MLPPTASASRHEALTMSQQHRHRPDWQVIQGGGEPLAATHPSNWRCDLGPFETFARIEAFEPSVALPAIRLVRMMLDAAESEAVARADAQGWSRHEITEVLGYPP